METNSVPPTSASEVKASDLLDSPAVAKAKASKKAAKKSIKKATKKMKKAVKAVKKAAKAAKKAEKKSRRAFSNAEVAKLLGGFKTIKELAKKLKVTTPAAQNYVNALKGIHKIETKEVRQGLRGPLAIAYRVG